jgi:putative ABC transport system permease protein
MLFGTLTGWLVAQNLVTVLQAVFDPPPETLSVPGKYLAGATVLVGAATALALLNALRDARVDPLRRIRELQ